MKRNIFMIIVSVTVAAIVCGCGAKSQVTGTEDSEQSVLEASEENVEGDEDAVSDNELADNELTDIELADSKMTSSDESSENETDYVAIFDLKSNENLSAALTMLAQYGVNYDENLSGADEEFWKGFSAALLCNSWYSPWDDNEDNYDELMDNSQVADAAYRVTGHSLECSYFAEGVDRSMAASPYLYDYEKINYKAEALSDGKIIISYDEVFYTSAVSIIAGMRRVNAALVKNSDSPFSGYSIYTFNSENLMNNGGIDEWISNYPVSVDNEECHNRLKLLLDGEHTTKDGECIKEILKSDDQVEYAFMDLNGDGYDEMVVRTFGYWLNVFVYTDNGILWKESPVSSSSEIWLAYNNYIVESDSHSAEDFVAIYCMDEDGEFQCMRKLVNYHVGDTERYTVSEFDSNEKDITKEEYDYWAEEFKNNAVEHEWEPVL